MDTEKSLDRNSFVWNAGGWFGSQIGGSVWMLFCALTVLPADAISGLVCLGSFAVINAVGCYLWQRREKIDPYVGLQRLFFTVAVACAVISFVLYRRGFLSSRESILLIVIPAALMTFLAFQNWAVKRDLGEQRLDDR